MKTKKFFVLFCLLAVTLIPVSFAQEESATVFTKEQWAHISVGGERIESVVWEGYGNNVQLVFFAYNDSSLSYDQFVIEANRSYSDPYNKFNVLWKGELTSEGQILLYFSSILGQTTTIVERFTGELPSWGRPGTEHRKSVITGEDKFFDVFIDDDHKCSFKWNFVSLNLTGNYTEPVVVNDTLPQLSVYDPDGATYSTKVLTTTGLPLIEYWDVVGFMVDSWGPSYVKWSLYSGSQFQVRVSQGFGGKSLPFFKVSPVSLSVYPDELVTVEFELPEGVSEFDSSWNDDPDFTDYILLEDEELYGNRYKATFRFLDSAKTRKKFTVKVVCEKYGTEYEAAAQITVLTPAWETLVPTIIGAILVIVGLIVAVFLLVRHRQSPPLSDLAYSEAIE